MVMLDKSEALTLFADAYKTGHRVQYPSGVTEINVNFTPRNTKYLNRSIATDGRLVVYGLKSGLKTLKTIFDCFFESDIELAIANYKKTCDSLLGKDVVDMTPWKQLHDLGYMPLEFRVLPEGTLIKEGTPVLTMHNTHPDFYWLPNYIEVLLTVLLWKPFTIANIAREYRLLGEYWAEKTGCPKEFVDYQFHDFSMRGSACIEDAYHVGRAWLQYFKGSDNIFACATLGDDAPRGFSSVPATEHSVMCCGSQENEFETYKRLLTETYPSGILSIVSDTWDYFQVLTDFLPRLKDTILGREGKLVIRPDSGNPFDIVCGTKHFYLADEKYDLEEEAHRLFEEFYAFEVSSTGGFIFNVVHGKEYFQVEGWVSSFGNEDEPEYTLSIIRKIEPTPEEKGSILLLWELFGGSLNEKGQKVLDPHIGLIYGDGITLDVSNRILSRLNDYGFCSSNIVFGVGAFSFHVTRDTLGFATKATYSIENGVEKNLIKNPKTGGNKKSHKGLLFVHIQDGIAVGVSEEVSRNRYFSTDNGLQKVEFDAL